MLAGVAPSLSEDDARMALRKHRGDANAAASWLLETDAATVALEVAMQRMAVTTAAAAASSPGAASGPGGGGLLRRATSGGGSTGGTAGFAAAAAGSGVGPGTASDHHADLHELEREGPDDSEDAKRLVMARYDEVADTRDKCYRPSLPREMTEGVGTGKGAKVMKYLDNKPVYVARNAKFVVEDTSPAPDPSTFVSLKVKRKGARGPGPGFAK